MSVEIVNKGTYQKLLNITIGGKHPPQLLVDLNVPYQVNNRMQNGKESAELCILDDPEAYGDVIIIQDYGATHYTVKDGIVQDSGETYLFPICKNLDMYRNDLVSALYNERDSGTHEYKDVFENYIVGEKSEEYKMELAEESWPVMINYTGKNPITYWVSVESRETDATVEDKISVLVNTPNVKAVKFICLELIEGENKRIVLTASDKTAEYPLSKKFGNEYPIALFSALDSICHNHPYTDKYQDVLRDVTHMIETFDYDEYIKTLEERSAVQGAGITIDRSATHQAVSEAADMIDMESSDAETDDPEDEIPEDAKIADISDSIFANRKEATPQPRKVRAATAYGAGSDGDIHPAKHEVSMPDLRVVPNELDVLHSFGNAEIPLHNFTGSTLRFIDNAYLSKKTGRYVIPDEGPHVIKTIEPEGKLSAFESVIELGTVNGVPISEAYPSRISALPDVDGIIIANVPYYKAAIRMGFQTGNIFLPNIKLEWKDEETGRVTLYYMGLQKRM